MKNMNAADKTISDYMNVVEKLKAYEICEEVEEIVPHRESDAACVPVLRPRRA